jgi:hypothetical protein
LDGEDDKYTIGIQELFSRPWWTRIWIVQEAAVAKVAWIACGADAIGFDCIRKLYEYANELSGLHYSEDTSKWQLKIASMLANLTLTTRALLYKWLGNKTTLLAALEMMYIGNNVHATDPRGRIYALLGIVSDTDALESLWTTPKATNMCTRRVHVHFFGIMAQTYFLVAHRLYPGFETVSRPGCQTGVISSATLLEDRYLQASIQHPGIQNSTVISKVAQENYAYLASNSTKWFG